jgi:hypothetical protein
MEVAHCLRRVYRSADQCREAPAASCKVGSSESILRESSVTTRNDNLVGSQDSEFQRHCFVGFFTHGYHTHELSLSAIAAIADVDLATSHDLVRDFLCSQY